MALSGDKLVAADAQADTQNTSGTTTSTSFTVTLSGGTACGIAFVAPNSGKVWIHNAANMFNSGAAHCVTGFRVRTGGVIGSGTDVTVAADSNSLVAGGAGGVADRHGVPYLQQGLTPGSTYNVQQLFHVDGGTGTFNNKFLGVDPVL